MAPLIPLIPLENDVVHVWLVAPGEIGGEQLKAYHELLCDSERARLPRFYFDRDRRQHLVARALVRTVLSRHTGVAPEQWLFREESHGRPEISSPLLGARVRFNLSHATGLIACAVMLERDVGIDVENTTRDIEVLDLARYCFAQAEIAKLQELPSDEDRRRRFFEFWTLKEAYIKARGLGLALPLEQFAFELAEDAPVRVHFDPRLGDDPGAWQFQLWQPTPVHQMALGVRRPEGLAVKVLLHQFSPQA